MTPPTEALTALVHYVQLHPVRSAAAASAAAVAIALAVAYLRYRRDEAGRSPVRSRLNARIQAFRLARARVRFRENYLRPALLLAGVLSLAVAGLAAAYRAYADRVVEEDVVAVDAAEASSAFGIDVSQYQARINWSAVADSEHPIAFVFIRATMGKDGQDERFRENWRGAARAGFLRGAYHFFRPKEDAEEQFLNFADRVELAPGDLRPVLDVEWRSRKGDAYLRTEVQRWLDLAEAHYGVKPIIYSGANFYERRLAGYFDAYPLWIAHYSDTPDTAVLDWRFHQFTDKVRVRGILDRVDGNTFAGPLSEMDELRVGMEAF